MRSLLALVLLLTMAASSASAGPCRPGDRHACAKRTATLNLNFDPAQGQRLGAAQPQQAAKKRSAYVPADPAPYNGPAFGVPPNGRGATIGYRWSTD